MKETLNISEEQTIALILKILIFFLFQWQIFIYLA